MAGTKRMNWLLLDDDEEVERMSRTEGVGWVLPAFIATSGPASRIPSGANGCTRTFPNGDCLASTKCPNCVDLPQRLQGEQQ